MAEFLDIVYLNNTLRDYFIFAVLSAVVLLLMGLMGSFMGRRQDDNEGGGEGLKGRLKSGVRPYLLPGAVLLIAYLATRVLSLGEGVGAIIRIGSTALVAGMGAMLGVGLSDSVLGRYGKNKERNELALKWLTGVIKFVIWSVAVVLFLDNVGVKVDSFVTGLGLGGVAIAFASQSIVADVFCFITIFFDRPFEVGDFIAAGDHSGVVEHIGVKTTRLRALGGEQLILSNADLTSARLQNYKNMSQIMARFTLRVAYDTPAEVLNGIPRMIKSIVESTPGVQFNRAYFANFGEYSAEFEVVYYALTGSYSEYREIRHGINLRIKDAFDKEGIALALPARQVFMDKNAPAVYRKD